MPVHDWLRVGADLFYSFHLSWIGQLMGALNRGQLPPGYYALLQQGAGRSRNLAIRHVSRHQLVALLEIVTPANKDRRSSIRELAERVVHSLGSGVHVLLIDLLPPTSHDPHGIHGEVWKDFDRTEYAPPPDRPLTVAAYSCAGGKPSAFVDAVAVGRPLIDMPLFLTAERYVNVPLEATYLEAYRAMPEYWRRVIEGEEPGA